MTTKKLYKISLLDNNLNESGLFSKGGKVQLAIDEEEAILIYTAEVNWLNDNAKEYYLTERSKGISVNIAKAWLTVDEQTGESCLDDWNWIKQSPASYVL